MVGTSMRCVVIALLLSTAPYLHLGAQQTVCGSAIGLDSATAASDLVFYGRVLENRAAQQVGLVVDGYSPPSWMTRRVQMLVQQVWKGELLDTVWIFVGLDSDTTRAIKDGKPYLVFASKGRTVSRTYQGTELVSIDTHVWYKPGAPIDAEPCTGFVSIPPRKLPLGGRVVTNASP